MTSKKLVILGATGATGQHLVTQALDAGHFVTALARTADRLSIRHERLRPVATDITTDMRALGEAVQGTDVVISALGRGLSFKSTNLIQRCVPPILSAMQSQDVRRLIFMSALGVGRSHDEAPLLARIFAKLFLRDIYADKEAGEALIQQSHLDWTLVRPPQLHNGALTRRYRAGEHLRLRGMPRMSRADAPTSS